MLFDRPVGALPEDGSAGPPLVALGEVEEVNLLQKVQEIIKAKPGKAKSLFEKFLQILKEERKEELICSHCGGWEDNQIRVSLAPSPGSDSAETLHKRGAQLRRKVAKKRKKVAKKKDQQKNIKSRKAERKQTGVETHNKLRKKDKQREKKKNINTRKASKKKKGKKNKKIKRKLKNPKEKRKIKQRNRERKKYLEKMEELNNCSNLWAELINIGFGAASTLKKQVMSIDLVKEVNSLAGKFHRKR